MNLAENTVKYSVKNKITLKKNMIILYMLLYKIILLTSKSSGMLRFISICTCMMAQIISRKKERKHDCNNVILFVLIILIVIKD